MNTHRNRLLIDTCVEASTDDTTQIAFDKGDWAASQCYRRAQNPYRANTALYQWWDAGWLNSYDELCGT